MPTKGKSRGEVSKFYRELYGYRNCSHYGRYHSQIKGFLDEVGSIRYSNGVFLVKKDDEWRVVRFLRQRGAKVTTWKVVPKVKEWSALQNPPG